MANYQEDLREQLKRKYEDLNNSLLSKIMFLKKYYPQGKFELYGAKNQFLWGSSFDLDQWFF